MTSSRQELNFETAKADWHELQSFFAQGLVLRVSSALDLLVVAEELAADNASRFEDWLASGEVEKVSDAQALKWIDAKAQMWTLVIKPWILVQECH